MTTINDNNSNEKNNINSSTQKQTEPLIATDDNWKQQAQKEKERLAQQEKQSQQQGSQQVQQDEQRAAQSGQHDSGPQSKQTQSSSGNTAAAPIPPANLLTIINSLTLQALLGLGRIADPSSKTPPPVNLNVAKLNIDLLQVLEDKTKGNLSEEEKQALSVSLQQLRLQYVQVASKQ